MDTHIDIDNLGRVRKHVEQNTLGAVHIFTGNEKQQKVRTNPTIYDRNADRVRANLDNEWANFENTPNREAQETYNRIRMLVNRNQSGGTTTGQSDSAIYRVVMEVSLNLGFLASNSNQLRLLNDNRRTEPTYEACLAMVILSLILQILVAVAMITISVNNDQRWIRLKNTLSVGASIICLMNIIVLSLLNGVVLQPQMP
ncbi:ninjurin-B-like [Uranotaenia lowii]|uniref:ninjurin-B-like n=1 Tax=Uranotaenia lowii TaxID=190385 RepID=UPI00247A2C2E|nr:ninjurin-B-like [Uranotaenia lowii]